MSVQSCVSDDLIEMTPPSAPQVAQQETRRLAMVLGVLAVFSCLCVLAVSNLSRAIAAHDTINATSFLPQIF